MRDPRIPPLGCKTQHPGKLFLLGNTRLEIKPERIQVAASPPDPNPRHLQENSHKTHIQALPKGFNDFLPLQPFLGQGGREVGEAGGLQPPHVFKERAICFQLFFLTFNPNSHLRFDASVMSRIHLNSLMTRYDRHHLNPTFKPPQYQLPAGLFFPIVFQLFPISSSTIPVRTGHGHSTGAGDTPRMDVSPRSSYRSPHKILSAAKCRLTSTWILKTAALKEILCPERRKIQDA